MKFNKSKLLFLAVVIFALVCTWLWQESILQGVAKLLVIETQQHNSNHVAVFEDSGDGCYDKAAKLYHEDESRRILLIEPDTEHVVRIGIKPSFEARSRRVLLSLGVPNKAITLLAGGASDSWKEVRLLGNWLKDHPDARVLVPVSRFSSRRYRYILDSVLEPVEAVRVEVFALTDRRYDETDWWKSRCGVKGFLFACLSLTYARCIGEDRTKPEPWDPDDYERTLQQTVSDIRIRVP